MLVDEGVITDNQLDEALRRQQERGTKTVDTLIYLGHMNSEEFVRFLSNQRGMPSISLRNYSVSDELLNLVPKEVAIEHEIFPIDRLGRLLTVGMVCPLDNVAIRALEELTGLKVKPMLCTRAEIREAIARHYTREEFMFEDDIPYAPIHGDESRDQSTRQDS